MILDLAYINKSIYIFNQASFKLIYLLSSPNTIDLYTRDICFLVNT